MIDRNTEQNPTTPCSTTAQLQPITLHLREDLARALRRCTWMIIHETGRTQPDIMEEMVRDFLVKHGC